MSRTKEVDGTQATTLFAYNERGQVWTETSPENDVTRRFYDVQGQLAETMDGEGYRTKYLRDGLEQVVAEEGPHPGRNVTYHYDAVGRAESKTVAAYGTTPEMKWKYEYPGGGQVVERARLPGGDITTTRTVNERGRLMSEVIVSGDGQRTRTFAFDGPWQASERTEEGDWLLLSTTGHDDLGRLTSSEERWQGGGHGYDYQASFAWSSLTASANWTDDAEGKHETYAASLETDSLGHLVSRTQDGVADGWLYDPTGKLSRRMPGGRPATVASYLNGLLRTSTYGAAPIAKVTTYGYHPDARVASVETPNGRTRHYAYDACGLVLSERYGMGVESTTTSYTYDELGNLATKTEGAGTEDAETWKFAYGPGGELQSTTQPKGIGTFEYTHDGLLRLTKVKPPEGSPTPETTYGYDYLGRQTRKAREASVWTTPSWTGGVGTTTSPVGDMVTRVYDGRGRIAEEKYVPGPASAPQTDITRVVRRYTGEDSPWETVETHAAGEVSTEYGYDGHRRLTSVTRGTDAVGYTYRDSGERESITSPLGTVSYGYDGLERLHSVTGLAGTTTVVWEAGGERLLSLRDGTLEERHCYDGRGWLTGVVNASSATSCSNLDSVTGLHSRFKYGCDGRGNRVSQDYLDGSLSASEVTAYGYNEADWLTGVRYPDNHAVLYGLGGDGTRVGEKEVSGYLGSLGPDAFATATNPTKDWTYGFDNQGGLLNATRPEVQPGGQVTHVEVASWTTDAAGRVTQSVTPEGTRTFAWSARDTLAQATFTPAVAGGEGTPVTVSYGYDGDGLRRSRTVDGDSTGYLWAAGQLLEERLPGNDVLYVNAAGMAVSANADRLAHDGLGSVVGIVGATTTTRKYDAWGGFLDGTVPTPVQSSLAYAGQAWDVDLGLSYAQQRWYDEATGRFLSTDPVGLTAERLQSSIGLNFFLYGNGNPLRFTDPDGRCSQKALEEGQCDDIYRRYEGLVGKLYQSDIEKMSDEAITQAITNVTTYRSLQDRSYTREEGIQTLCTLFDCRTGTFENLMHRVRGSAAATRVTGAIAAYDAKWKVMKEGTQELVKGAVFNALDSPSSGGLGNKINAGLADATKPVVGLAVKSVRLVVENKAADVFLSTVLGGVGVVIAKDRKLVSGQTALRQFDIDRYGAFNTSARVCDSLAGHEMLQNAWLERNGYAAGRGVGSVSLDNPAVALSESLHRAVGREQRALGLLNPVKLRAMSATENIELNAIAMRRAGVPNEVVEELKKEALRHAATLGAPVSGR